MTGYGSAKVADAGVDLLVEIRSVNSRFLDLSFRLPSSYACIEQELAKSLKEKLSRGRVEIFVTRKALADESYQIRFNEKLFADFLNLAKTQALSSGLSSEDASSTAFKMAFSRKEIIELAAADSALEESKLLQKGVISALDALIQMRKVEGVALEKDILSLLKALEQEHQKIKNASSDFAEGAIRKLNLKLEKYKKEIEFDKDRIAQEIAFSLDRASISEEVLRIESHFQQFKTVISKNEGGKKIEFLLQEFGREFNTIGSKSQASEITQSVIEAKSILEKIREQVANIE